MPHIPDSATSRLTSKDLNDLQITIAEHAMACPDHGVTTPNLRDGLPVRPALIWTADTGDGVALSSNGVPHWYDEDGQHHTAVARTWKHHTTGTTPGATGAGGDTAYVPLDSASGRPPVIDLLREGRHTGAHWVAIDLDAITGYRIGPDAIHLLGHRDQIGPPQATWRPALVTAAAVAGIGYPALVADGYTVRGDDVLARFDRRTVEEMATDLAVVNLASMPGELAVLRFDGDVLVVLVEHDDGVQTREREIDRVYPDPDGHYSVGAYLWPWTPV